MYVARSRAYDLQALRQQGGARFVTSEAEFRRVMRTLAAGRMTGGALVGGTVVFARPFSLSRPLLIPEGVDGITITATGMFAMTPREGVLASMFDVLSSRVTIRNVFCCSIDTARMFTTFVRVPDTASGVTGVRVFDNDVAADRVYVEEAPATGAFIRGNDHAEVNASHAAAIEIAGTEARLENNLLADGGVDSIKVTGGECSITGNDCGGGDITTSAGTGSNRLASNTNTGTKTLHATDFDADSIAAATAAATALIAAAADLSNWGDGSDGVMPSGAVTLTRDTFYTTGTPIAGDTLDPAGYQLYFSTHLDFSNCPAGWISIVGSTGADGAAGVGGAGGAAKGGLTAPGGSAGAAGGSGVAGSNGVSSTGAIGGSGGAGGPGGSLGGTAAAATSINRPRYGRESLLKATGSALMDAGLGGGGGGGGSSRAGGGAGGGAPSVVIRAKKITRGAGTAAGIISLIGGVGGAAQASAGAAAGGGGGGGGGSVWIHCGELAGVAKAGAVVCTGGAGGLRAPTAPPGGDGAGGDGGSLHVITPQGVTVSTGSAGAPAQALPTVTSGLSHTDTSNLSIYTTSAFTPAASDLIFLAFVLSDCVLATPVVTDSLGGTYSKVASAAFVTSTHTTYLYVKDTAATASSQTITVDNTGDAATGIALNVMRVAGSSIFGTAAVRQSATDPNRAGATQPSLTFGVTTIATTLSIGAVGNATNPATLTPPTNSTELVDTGYATPAIGLETVYWFGHVSTVLGWAGTTASGAGTVGVEVLYGGARAGGAFSGSL